MSENVWSALSDYFIKEINSGRIEYTVFRLAGGEPLLCFDSWQEYLPYIRRMVGNRHFDAVVLTNFTLLDYRIINYAIANDIRFSVSLDGTRHSKVDIHGNSTAQQVMQTIEGYVKDVSPVTIMTVLNESNTGTGEILELAEFVAKYQLSWNVNSDIYALHAGDRAEQMYKDLTEALQYLIKVNYPMDLFHFQFLNTDGFSSGCVAGKSLFSISTNGDIYPCQTCKGKPIGNILTCNDVIKALRKQTIYPIGWNYIRPEVCHPDMCEAFFVCKGSCKLNMIPGDNNIKCQLIRKLHSFFVKNELYRD